MGLFSRFRNWLDSETNCDKVKPPDSAHPVYAANESNALLTEPAEPGSHLKNFLTIQAPGSIVGNPDGLDSERSPLLLTIQRHRRIPIDWPAAIDIEKSPVSFDPLRRLVEDQWLRDAGLLDVIPKAAIIPLKQPSEYRIHRFSLPEKITDLWHKTEPVPKDSLLVFGKKPQNSTLRVFALFPRSTSAPLVAGISKWNDVATAIEVFAAEPHPAGNATPPLIAYGQELIRKLLALGKLDTTALPSVSSTVDPKALRNRLAAEYREELISDTLSAHLVRANLQSGARPAEEYWTLDQSKWWGALSQAFPFQFPGARPNSISDEQQFLIPLQGNRWIFQVGERRYASKFRSDLSENEIQSLDLTRYGDYDKAWKEMLVGLEPLTWKSTRDASRQHIPYAYIETVDLSPSLIVEEFSRSKAEYDTAIATAALGDKMLEQLKDKVDSGKDFIRETADLATQLKASLGAAEQRLRTLKERAARIGYHLATGLSFNGQIDNEIHVPTGPGTTRTESVIVGRLYRTEERFATYSVRESELRRSTAFPSVLPFSPFGPLGPIDPLGPLGPIGGNPLSPFGGLGDLGKILPGPLGDVLGGVGGAAGDLLGGVSDAVSGLFGGGGGHRHVDRQVQVRARYLGLTEVEIATEPWVIRQRILEAAGFHCVFAELTNLGYVSNDNTPIRELLARCTIDEAYRERLALFLPIYQERMSGERAKVRYLIAIRPEPGTEPSGFPTILCDESLSYRSEWKGMELGELLHGIALAPGEQRKVSITRSVEQRTERVQNITSVLDVTSSQKLDLSSSLQDTLSHEKNDKTSSNWNANASFSIGPFGGGGGGGGSQETSVRDFAESIKKSAMQSTREMRTNQRQEVKSSNSLTSTVSSTESTESTFTNINQGSTLNVLFYQLSNVYSAGFFLDELKIAYKPAVELVAGTNLHDLITFKLSDLASVISYACNDAVLTSGNLLFDRTTLERRVLRSAIKTILAEYVQPEPVLANDDSALDSALHDFLKKSSGLLLLDEADTGSLQTALSALTGKSSDSVIQECIRYTQILGKLQSKSEPFLPHTLIAPSSAVYADSAVGVIPATEVYSERMRAAELAKRWADVDKQQAEVTLTKSVARSLAPEAAKQSLPTVNASFVREPSLTLRVRSPDPLPEGFWLLLKNGAIMGRTCLTHPSKSLSFSDLHGNAADAESKAGHWLVYSPTFHSLMQLKF